MMKNVSFILLSLLLVCSCSYRNNDSAEFFALLDSLDLGNEKRTSSYLIIPSFSCAGCVQTTWWFLFKHQDELDVANEITIIDSYHRGEDPFALDLRCNIIKDSCLFLERTTFHFANPTIVKVKDNRVKSIVSTQANRMEEILGEQLLQ